MYVGEEHGTWTEERLPPLVLLSRKRWEEWRRWRRGVTDTQAISLGRGHPTPLEVWGLWASAERRAFPTRTGE